MYWIEYLDLVGEAAPKFSEALLLLKGNEQVLELMQDVVRTVGKKVSVVEDNSGKFPSATWIHLSTTVAINTHKNDTLEELANSIVFELCNAVQTMDFEAENRKLKDGTYKSNQGWAFAREFERIEYKTQERFIQVMSSMAELPGVVGRLKEYTDNTSRGFNDFWSRQKHTSHAGHYRSSANEIIAAAQKGGKQKFREERAAARKTHRVAAMIKFLNEADNNNPGWRRAVGLPSDDVITSNVDGWYEILAYLRRRPNLVTREGLQDLSWKSIFKHWPE